MLLTTGQKLTAHIAGEKFEVRVRGWQDGKYIIADIPMCKGEPLTLVELTGCEILFIKDGAFIKFMTKVVRVYYQSPPIMIIAFPVAVDKKNLRKHQRFPVSVPISFRVGGGLPFDGLMRDLSLGGALITAEYELLKGDDIAIAASLKFGKLNGLKATVQNVREYTKNRVKYNAAGLKFAELSSNDKAILQAILDFHKNQANILAPVV